MRDEYQVKWGQPNTRRRLLAAGYVFTNLADCRLCHQPMQWAITPKGKKQPWDLPEPRPGVHEDDVPIKSHFATCPETPANKRAAAMKLDVDAIKASARERNPSLFPEEVLHG